MAIGAPLNDSNGNNSGHVRVYDWNGSAWTQLGADIDGEAVDDILGFSVSLSSRRVAIGASGNDGNGNNSGHVRVYDYNGNAWTQVGGNIDGEAAGDYSGSSVSLSSDGTRVAIGAAQNDSNGNDSGHVRVYDYNGSAWAKVGDDIDGEAADNLSGYSVSCPAMAGGVAIGAPQNDSNVNNSGHVRVYDYNGSAWAKVGDDIDGEAADNLSGYSVSCPAMAGGWRLGRLKMTATLTTQATCGSTTTMAVLGLKSVTTSTARRPIISRATLSPCPAMAGGWRLGRL